MNTEEITRALIRAPAEKHNQFAVLPTGSVSLDILLNGGWRKGAISELYGPPDCGTTTVALRTIAAVQRAYPDQIAVMYDSSPGTGSRLTGYAASLGADLDRLIIASPHETLPVLPGETSITVVDGYSRNLPPPRDDLDATILVIPRNPGHIRSAAQVRLQRSHGARWTWAETASPGRMPSVPVSLGTHPWFQEILQTALQYGVSEIHGKRWYYCDQRKIGGGWHDAVRMLRNDTPLLEKIINRIAETTMLDSSNWLTSPALCG